MAGDRRNVRCRPRRMVAIAFHPSQVEQARQWYKRHGINAEIHPDGTVEVPSQRELRKICRLEGLRDYQDYSR